VIRRKLAHVLTIPIILFLAAMLLAVSHATFTASQVRHVASREDLLELVPADRRHVDGTFRIDFDGTYRIDFVKWLVWIEVLRKDGRTHIEFNVHWSYAYEYRNEAFLWFIRLMPHCDTVKLWGWKAVESFHGTRNATWIEEFEYDNGLIHQTEPAATWLVGRLAPSRSCRCVTLEQAASVQSREDLVRLIPAKEGRYVGLCEIVLRWGHVSITVRETDGQNYLQFVVSDRYALTLRRDYPAFQALMRFCDNVELKQNCAEFKDDSDAWFREFERVNGLQPKKHKTGPWIPIAEAHIAPDQLADVPVAVEVSMI